MQASDIPVKMPTPFASAAGGAFVRTVPIPDQTGSDPSAASFSTGFPPNTFEPVASGGTGPYGQDMNGLLLAATAWLRWQQAGGPIKYDSAFSSAVGGYPLGAILQSSATAGLMWVSTANNNTTDPDGGSPANWTAVQPRGTAGGDLTGTYPNPTVANGAITNAKRAAMPTGTVSANLSPGSAAPADWTLAQLASALNLGAQSIGTSGFYTFPGGLMVQWATVAPGDDTYVSYALPTAFPNAHFGGVATIRFNNVPPKTGGNGGGAFYFPIDTSHAGVGIAWNGDATGISSVFYVAFGN